MSDDTVNLEVDGQAVEARKGQMIIEVTDRIGTYIPRFCYHEKLSIAANCRMCLVEVEKAPKPLPACATPVGEGMKVFTRSPRAISAQKATMEFLLINHPLDCPICDQGGECELQDLAMGFGRDVSRYQDRKRVVKDKDIGPLVSTDMTRCIHCTRCVRFGEEISGLQELGTTERGEDMKIGTFVEKSIDHELSANIIDLCPVGALNNKPYRYSARAWEMEQMPTVSAHDCVGSNLYAHVLRGTVKRIVPRTNEAINETWISDRDRFSYEGIYSNDRLHGCRIKEDGTWRDLSWEDALEHAAGKLKSAGANTGVLASPSVTIEEAHLLARLADHLGTANLDHRLRQVDFSDQDNDPATPWLGCELQQLDDSDAILLVGSNVRREAPIIAHRVRKAALNGGKICFVNSDRYDYFFDVEAYAGGDGLLTELAGVAVAAGGSLPGYAKKLCKGVKPSDTQRRIAEVLKSSERGRLILGQLAVQHPDYAAIRALASAIGELTGVSVGAISAGANGAGAHLAGVLPHRGAGGLARKTAGLDARHICDGGLDAVMLFNVEPDKDLAAGDRATKSLAGCDFVIALSPYATPALEECADLLLPIGTFAETSGTYINCEGRWQSFPGVAAPLGAARPGWKVLRVLGNLLNAPDFDYQDSTQVCNELRESLGELSPDNGYAGSKALSASNGAGATDSVPIYQVDGVVRRAVALQLTPEALRDAASGESQ